MTKFTEKNPWKLNICARRCGWVDGWWFCKRMKVKEKISSSSHSFDVAYKNFSVEDFTGWVKNPIKIRACSHAAVSIIFHPRFFLLKISAFFESEKIILHFFSRLKIQQDLSSTIMRLSTKIRSFYSSQFFGHEEVFSQLQIPEFN